MNSIELTVGSQSAFTSPATVPAEDKYHPTTEALWKALGFDWLEARRQCVILERDTGRTLIIETEDPETAYDLRVRYHGRGNGAEHARWSVEMERPDADGFGGGADVQHVTSDTGHSAEALNDHLWAFHRLAVEGKASILRGD